MKKAAADIYVVLHYTVDQLMIPEMNHKGQMFIDVLRKALR